jgi:hypothetical protein
VPGAEVVYNPPDCDLSPDGKWILWLSDHKTWIAASLDGTQARRWPNQRRLPSHCCWLPDGQHWAELASHLGLNRYTLREAVVRSIHQDSAPKTAKLNVVDGLLLGLTHRGGILIHHLTPQRAVSRASFAEVTLDAPKASVRTWTVALPVQARVHEVALSRAGDRLAWMLGTGEQEIP